jgi:hypothetical protein
MTKGEEMKRIKDIVVGFRTYREEYESIKSLAEKEKMTVSKWVYSLVERQLKVNVNTSPTIPPIETHPVNVNNVNVNTSPTIPPIETHPVNVNDVNVNTESTTPKPIEESKLISLEEYNKLRYGQRLKTQQDLSKQLNIPLSRIQTMLENNIEPKDMK